MLAVLAGLLSRVRKPRTSVVAIVAASGLVAGLATAAQTTVAGFADTTVNTSNSFQSGQVSLTDDDSGTASFSTGSPRNNGSLATGASLTKCISVTYTGTSYARYFSDAFASQDTSSWSGFGSSISVSGGVLNINITPNVANYQQLNSVNSYDFRKSAISVEAVGVPNVGNGTTEMNLNAVFNFNNSLVMMKANNRLRARMRVGGSNGTDVTVIWNASTMRYWQIESDASNVYWQYSADRVTWATLRTEPIPFALDTMKWRLEGDTYSTTETNPGTATFDNFTYDGVGGVRMYGSSTGALAPYLNLTVERGTGGSFSSCSGFSGSTIYSGTLADFTTIATDYPSGIGGWPPTSSPASRTYRITVTVQNDTNAQGTSASGTFTWECQTTAV